MISTPSASLAWCASVLRRLVDAQMTKPRRFTNLFSEIIEEPASMKGVATLPQPPVPEPDDMQRYYF